MLNVHNTKNPLETATVRKTKKRRTTDSYVSDILETEEDMNAVAGSPTFQVDTWPRYITAVLRTIAFSGATPATIMMNDLAKFLVDFASSLGVRPMEAKHWLIEDALHVHYDASGHVAICPATGLPSRLVFRVDAPIQGQKRHDKWK